MGLEGEYSEEFFVEVSGRSARPAALSVFLETQTKAKCAPNAPTEETIEGVQGENPAQSVPGENVEKYPTTFATSFTGSFDWDTNMLTLITEGVKPGPKLICAYLSPPGLVETVEPSAEEKRIAEQDETGVEPKTVPLKPLLTAHATLKVVKGKAPKHRHAAAERQDS